MKRTYAEMYREAAEECNNENEYYYKGFTAGNALSLYVEEKYNVNAAANESAHDALFIELKS